MKLQNLQLKENLEYFSFLTFHTYMFASISILVEFF